MNGPSGIALDGQGNLFTADTGNNRIRKIAGPYVCGNGALEPGEQCDDGNTTSGDCCSSTCTAAPDADADGKCDAIDACTNVGGARTFVSPPKSKLVLARIDTDVVANNDKLALTASFNLPVGKTFADLHPDTNGARLVVATDDGDHALDVALPAGTYSTVSRIGWRRSGSGKAWTFLNKSSTPTNGIAKLVVTDRASAAAPRQVKLVVSGKDGQYAVMDGDSPVQAIVTLGNAADAAAGMCGESAYVASECAFNGSRNQITCRR